MKCYKHQEKDAVSTCKDCWVWLCSDCTSKYSFPICDSCNFKRFESEKHLLVSHIKKYKYIWIWISILAVIIILPVLTGNFNLEYKLMQISQVLLMAYCWAFIGYGLDFINWLKDPNTITIRTNEWLYWFLFRKIFKYSLAMVIWWFVWPFQLYKMKKRIKEVDMNINYINQNL